MASQGETLTDLLDPTDTEWQDFQTLFGPCGSIIQSHDEPHNQSADFGDFLGVIQEPEHMSWERSLSNTLNKPSNDHQEAHPPFAEHGSQQDGPKGMETSAHSNANSSSERAATNQNEPGRRKQPRIPPEARKYLEDYYARTPYPAAWEYDIIAHDTRLEKKKVQNWFNRTRSRQPAADDADTTIAQVSSRPKSDRLSKDSLEKLLEDFDPNLQPPLEAWMASSMQSEPVAVAAIEAAVAKRNSEEGLSWGPSQTTSLSMMSRAASMHSSWAASSGGSAATWLTKYSSSSIGSNFSTLSRTRRKGRKRIPTAQTDPYPNSQDRKATQKARASKSANGVYSAAPENERQERPYFCTFCGTSFKHQYEWSRHEQSVHIQRSTWVCCGVPEVFFNECPFCATPSPDNDHLETHGFFTCKSQPEENRTFYRKDNFISHLHSAHFSKHRHPNPHLGCSKGSGFGCSALAERWRRPAPALPKGDPALHCGFCGEWFNSWAERRTHVASYFSVRGFDLSTWWPERLPKTADTLKDTWNEFYQGPLRCRYCQKDFATGDWSHTLCRVWSCRFLGHANDLIQRDGFDPCLNPFSLTAEHANNFRDCDQDFYTHYEDFLIHLQESHKALAAWQHNDYHNLKQNYSRLRRAVFEPVPKVNYHPNDSIPSHGCTSHSVLQQTPQQHCVTRDLSPEIANQVALKETTLPWSSSPPLLSQPLSDPNTDPFGLHPQPNVRMNGYSSPVSDIIGEHSQLTIDPNVHKPTSSGFPSMPPLEISATKRPTPVSSPRLPLTISDAPPRFFLGSGTLFSKFPTLYYLKGGLASTRVESYPKNVVGLSEISKGFAASLVMSSGLVGMASQGLASTMHKDEETGWIGFGVE